MKKAKHTEIRPYRTWIYHALILSFSLLLSILVHLIGHFDLFSISFLEFFLVLFLQLEVFVYVGTTLFRNRPGTSAREITLNTFMRFFIFYITCLLAALAIQLLVKTIMQLGQHESAFIPVIHFFRYNLKQWAIITNGGLVLGGITFFILQWQDSLKREQELTQENLVFQYETLKSQVNPHFLFNSLNTLQTFIRNKPGVAEEYVSKLASIYRYITDKGDENEVTIGEELAFVEDYFYLQKLRDEDKISLKAHPGIDVHRYILPVSIQILIENAFKHNIATEEHPLDIDIFYEDDAILVKNNLQRTNSIEPSKKTGLTNLNKRYKLITGREIEVHEDMSYFTVKVPVVR